MNRWSNTRAEILQQLERSEVAAASLVAGMSAEQANWRPNPGSWSIWQCLDHLARINRVYCGALLEAVERAAKTGAGTSKVAPGWLSRQFINRMEPPARTRFKAPQKAIPGADGDIQVALDEFLDSHETIRRIVASWDTVDLNHVHFRNPFVSLFRFTIGTGLMIINAHDRRHIWQAQKVKEAELFPSA